MLPEWVACTHKSSLNLRTNYFAMTKWNMCLFVKGGHPQSMDITKHLGLDYYSHPKASCLHIYAHEC